MCAATSDGDDPAAAGDRPAVGGSSAVTDEARWVAHTLERLSRSAFRARFELSDADRAYARAKGRATIDRHAHEMLRARVGAAFPDKDGRQTPWRGHPVFTAQHATACCCRGCIAKWHHIPKGRALTDDEVDRLADLVMAWIERDLASHPATRTRAGSDGKPASAYESRYVQGSLLP